jgi:hypothetical protein
MCMVVCVKMDTDRQRKHVGNEPCRSLQMVRRYASASLITGVDAVANSWYVMSSSLCVVSYFPSSLSSRTKKKEKKTLMSKIVSSQRMLSSRWLVEGKRAGAASAQFHVSLELPRDQSNIPSLFPVFMCVLLPLPLLFFFSLDNVVLHLVVEFPPVPRHLFIFIARLTKTRQAEEKKHEPLRFFFFTHLPFYPCCCLLKCLYRNQSQPPTPLRRQH